MTKYNEDWRIKEIMQAAREGVSIAGCARAGGISHETLCQWRNNNPEFSERFERARSEGERRLVKDVGTQRPDWLLATSYGYKKTEGKEISGPEGRPIAIEQLDLSHLSNEELAEIEEKITRDDK